jgi:hypothetical protein
VEKLPYVTGRGHAVSTVVSTKGIFKKAGSAGELSLAACFPDVDIADIEGKIGDVRDHCGWPLGVGPRVEVIPEPSRDELDLLRWLLKA